MLWMRKWKGLLSKFDLIYGKARENVRCGELGERARAMRNGVSGGGQGEGEEVGGALRERIRALFAFISSGVQREMREHEELGGEKCVRESRLFVELQLFLMSFCCSFACPFPFVVHYCRDV